MLGKIYDEEGIRKALRSEIVEIEQCMRDSGAKNPHVDLEDYLTESVHTGTIEVVDL
ncbi:hypothetical protein SEA_PINKCREEK_95 [Mycobacterium phage Pinkcreek]|nr:hypothetical protein SEA_PINKCREEK_95 [Mycobacterium phage Pinkcreek]